MPKIERWENFPEGVRQHLIERIRDRAMEPPKVLCGNGSVAKTFLLRGQVAMGKYVP